MEKDLPDELQEARVSGIPPLRTFVVRRYRAETPDDPKVGIIEYIVVSAHILHTSDAGVLSFTEFVVDPALGPMARVRRAFREWLDVEEIVTPPSTTIIH